MDSIKDYPQYITDNAKKAKDWVEKNGYGSCMTPVGKTRLNQLANREPISLDTLKRMKAYADRHKKDLSASKTFDDGCGRLAWFAWGLDETGRAEKWLESKINTMEKFNEDVSGLPPYTEEVTKKVVRKPVLASLPLFETKEDAEAMAGAMGCKGSHPHQYGDKTLYMPCEKHPEDMSEDEVICKECGWSWKISDGGDDPFVCHKCGYNNKFGLEDACWPGYEAIGLKDDGTPNCVPIKNEMSFSVLNADQRIVVGPAMIPDKMIIRRNDITGEIYYVYFTAETIKKLMEKFMHEKLLDKTNIEHGRQFLNNVDVIESWIIEDPKLDKQQVFGMEYPKGTWMISMKVNDDKTWNQVKDGKLKGFSVQGYFLEKAKFGSVSNEIIDEIKRILNEIE